MQEEQGLNRRHPAHHAPVEKFNEPVIVQVNICTKDRRCVLACEACQQLCREVWRSADFWRVGEYVIMPDHIHLFCVPGRIPMPSLSQWVKYWKGQIARHWPVSVIDRRPDDTEVIPPEFKLWQRDFWDTQIRSREHYEEKLSYVRMNPVRKALAATPEDWPYRGVIHEVGWR